MSTALHTQWLGEPLDNEARQPVSPAAAGRQQRDWPAAAPDAALLHVAIEHMAHGVLMLDVNQRIAVINRKFLRMYGLPGAIIKAGATAYDLVEQSVLVGNYGEVTVQDAWAAASKRLACNEPWRIKQRLPNGHVISVAYEPIPGGGWVTTHLDVTTRQIDEDRIAHLAHHDPLTGLANRALLQGRLTADLEAGISFAILVIDLDRFKIVNDTLGHAFGDELLRQVAARIVGQVRPDGLVARLGGDEFLVQIPSPTSPVGAKEVADNQAALLTDTLCRPFELFGQCAQIGASIGFALAPHDGRTYDTLMRCADLALYQAKSEGRGTTRAYGQHLATLRSEGAARPRRG